MSIGDLETDYPLLNIDTLTLKRKLNAESETSVIS